MHGATRPAPWINHGPPTSREPFPDEDGTHLAASRVPDRRDCKRKASICVERVVALHHLPGLRRIQIAILIMNNAALGGSEFPTAEIRNEAVCGRRRESLSPRTDDLHAQPSIRRIDKLPACRTAGRRRFHSGGEITFTNRHSLPRANEPAREGFGQRRHRRWWSAVMRGLLVGVCIGDDLRLIPGAPENLQPQG
jgi:hypothetical protein